MLVLDPTTGKHLGIFFSSAYVPTSYASETDLSDLEDLLASAISHRNSQTW
jgi:hypothetical protein